MVFVTVGTATQGFLRLLEAVDHFAGIGLFEGEMIFMQTGAARGFVPQHCEATAFVPRCEYERLVIEAGLIISHGGVSLLEMIRHGKVPIVMPRRRRYGEHVNDHQLELVELLASQNRIVPAWEGNDLPTAVHDARGRVARPVERSEIVTLVGAALRELTG